METYKIYVGGKFVSNNYELEIKNPYNNKLIAKTYLAQNEELNEAIKRAEAVLKIMKEMPSYKRYDILMQVAFLIEFDKERLALILSQEAAKPLKYARVEIDRAIQTFIIAAEESKRLPKEYISIDFTKQGENKEGLVKYFPIGIIAGIAPFNFPLNLAVHKIAPAIASGNPIILKPAHSTPLSVLELAKIIDKTELPKGALSILPMNRETGNQLVSDKRLKMLTFTGSAEVGWKMKSEAGKKKVTLELGGNAGAIITESSDLEVTVKKCVIGGFAYSGQVCIHLQRIYVHDSIFNEFIKQMLDKTLTLNVGDPTNEETDISSMIDIENAVRVEKWVEEAVFYGAKVLCGGKRTGTFYEPTLITNTKPEMKICSCEIFGPVVIVEKYYNFYEAIEQINNTEYGLQAGVFTNDIKQMNEAFNYIEAGGVIINDVPTFRVDNMPYGGIKNSGFGREGVKYAIYDMLEPKLLVKNIL